MPNCPKCNGPVDAADLFCEHCGQNLTPEGQAAPKDPGPTPAPAGPSPSSGGTPGQVRPGDYLKTGWELFKQYPGGLVGFALLYGLATLLVTWLTRFLPLSMVVSTLASAALAPFGVGGFIVCAKLLQRRPVEFGDFFQGLNLFLPIFLLALVSSILILLGFILLIIPGLYLLTSYLFAPLLVLDRKLDFWPAMEMSRKTVQPQFFGFFVFLLLLMVINIAGALALGVGLLVTGPISIGALTAAYAEIFGFSSDFS